jgi:tripeptide aminopeptidase
MTLALQPVTASTEERRYLSGTFAELCRIESPSGHERDCAERVIAELRALGVHAQEDDAVQVAGSDCGNLLARIPARGTLEDGPPAASVLLCAHLDTVPLAAPVEPVLLDGYWQNANPGILGADNKAAIAVLLALARRVCRVGLPLDIELLFTVGEERSLAGAHAFDVTRLRSQIGYVFDHASPIGEIIVASPTHYRLEARFHGAAAHAGVRPEEGRSAIVAAARAIAAMPHGRVDDQSTVNVGTIRGGSAVNVVPERCTVVAEIRSLSEDRAAELVERLVDIAHQAANMPECDCDVEVTAERTFSGYEMPARTPVVRAAEAALNACGHQPVTRASGGASDANALAAKGVAMVNLANGTERNHEPGERVSTAALEAMLDVALILPDAVAAQSPAAAR